MPSFRMFNRQSISNSPCTFSFQLLEGLEFEENRSGFLSFLKSFFKIFSNCAVQNIFVSEKEKKKHSCLISGTPDNQSGMFSAAYFVFGWKNVFDRFP
jgi:hypothetical protein